MKHRLFAIFSTLSLLTSIVTAHITARSFRTVDHLLLRRAFPAINVDICFGRIDIGIHSYHSTPPWLRPHSTTWTSERLDPDATWLRHLHDRYWYHETTTRFSLAGISYRTGFADSSGSEVPVFDIPFTAVTFPLWILIICLLIFPISQLLRYLRQRNRLNRYLCPTCSYNLQAHAPGQCCPECGTPIPPTPEISVKSV